MLGGGVGSSCNYVRNPSFEETMDDFGLAVPLEDAKVCLRLCGFCLHLCRQHGYFWRQCCYFRGHR